MSLKMFIKSKTQRKKFNHQTNLILHTLNQFFQSIGLCHTLSSENLDPSVGNPPPPSTLSLWSVPWLICTQYRFVENLLHTQTAHAHFWLTVFQNPFRSPADFLSPQKEENASKKGRSSGKKEEVIYQCTPRAISFALWLPWLLEQRIL